MAHRPGVGLLTAMQGSLGMDLAREHRPDLILLDTRCNLVVDIGSNIIPPALKPEASK